MPHKSDPGTHHRRDLRRTILTRAHAECTWNGPGTHQYLDLERTVGTLGMHLLRSWDAPLSGPGTLHPRTDSSEFQNTPGVVLERTMVWMRCTFIGHTGNAPGAILGRTSVWAPGRAIFEWARANLALPHEAGSPKHLLATLAKKDSEASLIFSRR